MAVYNYITDTGVIVPDAGEINTQVQDEYRTTFGQDLVTDPSTPQGLLITSETLARIAVAENNATLANQINPNLAGGIFLDAIMALTGSFRSTATPSTVFATISGVEGTSIPAGSQASETGSGNANLFATVATVLIPVGGIVEDVEFQSVETGPIASPVGTLTTIVSQVLGWETLTDSTEAVLGEVTQSDVAARQERLNTLAAQGSSTAEAITSRVMQVPNVKSVAFLENVESTTETIEDVLMVANSIYLCVDGGDSLAIAEAMVATKSAGAAYNNGAGIPVTQPVTVPFSGQIIDVLFDRPDPIAIYVRITVTIVIPVQDPQQAVTDAILNYANGLIDNIPGLGVGQDVSPFELAGAIAIQFPGIYVQLLEISLLPASGFASVEIPIGKYEVASILSSYIVVTVS